LASLTHGCEGHLSKWLFKIKSRLSLYSWRACHTKTWTKLQNVIYGKKTSVINLVPKDSWILYGMRRNYVDYDFYYLGQGDLLVVLMVYVDDVILMNNDIARIHKLK
jgi:hypothetical protein